MFDTSRNPYNATNLELDANNSNAESTLSAGMDVLSNGFKLRSATDLNSNSGDTFIYMAFAENPFKYSLAR
jgi:ribosome-associated toxin RatA of RatAB toxin-antitoxin module